MDISEVIKNLRKRKGITQQELANKIHKTVSSVKKYEAGEVTPPSDVLLDILNSLDVNLYIDSTNSSDIRKYIRSKSNTIDDKTLREMEIFINEYIDFKLKKD